MYFFFLQKKKNASSIRKRIFKRKKINRRKLKLPSASEIELNRKQSTSLESENDYDSIFDASEV